MTVAAEILSRWPRIFPGIVDTARWAENYGFGLPTPRRPGDPPGRDLAPDHPNPDNHRPGPWDYELGGPGQKARNAIQGALDDLRAADRHLCAAAARTGIEWAPVRPHRTAAAEILALCGDSNPAVRRRQPGVLICTARTIAGIVDTVSRDTAARIEKDLVAADKCVIRADSTLAKALEIVHQDDRPTVAAECANPACKGLAREGRKLCPGCQKWSERHHGELRPPGRCASVGPSDAEQGRQAQAQRMLRGEGWGTGVLPRAQTSEGAA